MKVKFFAGELYKTLVLIPSPEICWDMDAFSVSICFLKWIVTLSVYKKEYDDE